MGQREGDGEKGKVRKENGVRKKDEEKQEVEIES